MVVRAIRCIDAGIPCHTCARRWGSHALSPDFWSAQKPIVSETLEHFWGSLLGRTFGALLGSVMGALLGALFREDQPTGNTQKSTSHLNRTITWRCIKNRLSKCFIFFLECVRRCWRRIGTDFGDPKFSSDKIEVTLSNVTLTPDRRSFWG